MKRFLGTLEYSEVVSGLNDELEGFVTIRSFGDSGNARILLTGQLSPAQCRQLALTWLEVAEAAEHDSIVAKEMVETMKLPVDYVLMFIAALRERRMPDESLGEAEQ